MRLDLVPGDIDYPHWSSQVSRPQNSSCSRTGPVGATRWGTPGGMGWSDPALRCSGDTGVWDGSPSLGRNDDTKAVLEAARLQTGPRTGDCTLRSPGPRRASPSDLGFELEVDLTFDDVQSPPPPARGSVGALETVGKRVLVPGAGLPDETEAVREFGTVAERTVDGGPHAAGPSVGVEHPWSRLERGSVTDVLVVEARQLRHPVTVAVGVETDNRADHRPVPPSGEGLGHPSWPCVCRPAARKGGLAEELMALVVAAVAAGQVRVQANR